jgi:hypothetical protein
VTVDFDARTMLEFLKDLLLSLKDISKTVPDSGEWWLATYQSRMSWLPRTPEQLSLDDADSRFLGLSRILQRALKGFIVSTWEAFHKLHNLKKLKISFEKAGDPGTENGQRLLFEMISFTCSNIESLTVSSSPRLMITSATNFHNVEHLNQGLGKSITFPKGPFPIVNQSLNLLDSQRHEAVMGGKGRLMSFVTIIPPYEYIQAFCEPEPEPPGYSRRMEFDNHRNAQPNHWT